jgi:hypothetical protein
MKTFLSFYLCHLSNFHFNERNEGAMYPDQIDEKKTAANR